MYLLQKLFSLLVGLCLVPAAFSQVPSVSITISSISVVEGEIVTICIDVNDTALLDPQNPPTLMISTEAPDNGDFVPLSEIVTLTADERICRDIRTIDDNTVETVESYNVSLSSANGVILADYIVDFFIRDNGDRISLDFVSGELSGTEGEEVMTCVIITDGSNEQERVNFRIIAKPVTTSTFGDYLPLSDDINIPVGATEGVQVCVPVILLADRRVEEREETFTLSIAGPLSGQSFVTPARTTKTVTIIDGDRGTVIVGSPLEVVEGNSTTESFNIVLHVPTGLSLDRDIVYNTTLQDGSATALCEELQPPINGFVDDGGRFVGTKATYSCEPTYEVTGSNSLMCLEGLVWDNEPPTCIIQHCSSPPAVENAGVIVNDNAINGTAIYICNDNYQLTSNSINTRTCFINQTWSNETIICDPVPTLSISITGVEKDGSVTKARVCITLQYETGAQTLQLNLRVYIVVSFVLSNYTMILSRSYTSIFLNPKQLESCVSRSGPDSTGIITAEIMSYFPSLNIIIPETRITIIIDACDETTTSTIYGTYLWPRTEAGTTFSQKCVFGPTNSSVSRECNSRSQWNDDIDFSNCNTQYDNIAVEDINSETVVGIIMNLALLLDTTQENEQLQENFDIISSVLSATETVVSESTFNNTELEEIVLAVTNIVDDLHVWEDIQITNISVVEVFENVAEALAVNDDELVEQVLEFKGNASELVIERMDVNLLQTNGRIFNGPSLDDKGRAMASIQLLNSLFQSEVVGNNINGGAVATVFTFFENAALFPLRNATRLQNTSSVIGALVGGVPPISDLTEPAIITLTIQTTEDELIKEAVCVSWNFTTLDGFGNWTDVGCSTSLDQKTSTVTCKCTHLTNFAALVDICSRTEGKCEPTGVSGRTLLAFSYIGISLSIVGLILTIVTLLFFSELRRRDASKFHIQLSVAMLGMLLVFLAGIDQTDVFEGCVAVSALIHYFTLASVMWMGAEALLMFHKLVTVFFHITTKYLVIVSLFCWVTPIVPVIISLLINPHHMVTYHEMPNQQTIDLCFIGNVGILFGAFLGPIVVVLIFNIVIFIIVMKVLFQVHRGKHVINDDRKADARRVKQLPISSFGITALFGISWLFGVFTISSASVVFQYLFTIFTSLQGFFIFFFFCVMGKQHRQLWIGYFRRILGYTTHSIKQVSSGDTSKDKKTGNQKLKQTVQGQENNLSTDTTGAWSVNKDAVSSIEMESLPGTIPNKHAIEEEEEEKNEDVSVTFHNNKGSGLNHVSFATESDVVPAQLQSSSPNHD